MARVIVLYLSERLRKTAVHRNRVRRIVPLTVILVAPKRGRIWKRLSAVIVALRIDLIISVVIGMISWMRRWTRIERRLGTAKTFETRANIQAHLIGHTYVVQRPDRRSGFDRIQPHYLTLHCSVELIVLGTGACHHQKTAD